MQINQKMNRVDCGRLGYLKTKHLHEARNKARQEDYNNNPKLCKNCNQKISFDKKQNEYCNQRCAGLARGKRPDASGIKICNHCQKQYKSYIPTAKFCSPKCHKDYEFNLIISEWKNGNKKGYRGKTMQISEWLRKYLLIKYENKCCKCGWNQLHPVTGKTPLEVNHIDGDASNCKESNLEIVCPNCHSLTPNFRALNKKSLRKRR